jgi:hypothetical protein
MLPALYGKVTLVLRLLSRVAGRQNPKTGNFSAFAQKYPPQGIALSVLKTLICTIKPVKMKRIVSVFVLLMAASGFLPLQAQKVLKQVITIQLPEGDGSNSAAIAWHPIQKKYYTSMAGNAIYPMGVYNALGKPVQENVDAEYDYRGMWYNPMSKRIEFNCYDSGGIGHLVLDAKGKIDSKVIDFEGMNQPDNQCVGVYHTTSNYIIYLAAGYTVEKYSPKTGEPLLTLTTLHAGCKTKKEADELDADTEATRWEQRNASSVQFTGMPKAELAILNVEDHTIELYDQKTGLLTKVAYKIPESITIYPNFNFSYTNGIWWFFNKDERKWVGCK